MITPAFFVAIGKVRKVSNSSNTQEMCSIKMDLVGTSITFLVPRSFCFDSKGVQILTDGMECYIKAELTNDNNVKSFDGNYRASLSYRIDRILDFHVAKKEDEVLAAGV